MCEVSDFCRGVDEDIDRFTLEDGADKLWLNIGKQLST
jgi:hypothetical protein